MQAGSAAPILVIGCGNAIREDDAAGLCAVEAVEALAPAGVQCLVRHQLLPELAEPISQSRAVVFVDARADRLDQPVIVEPLASDPTGAGLGHFGGGGSLLALAEALYGHAPPAWLVTIPGASFGFNTEMTDAGRAGVHEAVRRTLELLAELAAAQP
ncbi:MAG: hydrogenase maturation protease [Armatimonadetes bacterium]|nr:hydrogenase maturation protease [Armatimonadota bacterium]